MIFFLMKRPSLRNQCPLALGLSSCLVFPCSNQELKQPGAEAAISLSLVSMPRNKTFQLWNNVARRLKESSWTEANSFYPSREFSCLKIEHNFSNPLLARFLLPADKTILYKIVPIYLPTGILWESPFSTLLLTLNIFSL